MKSTIKIDLESQHTGSTPVIKIIQSIDALDENSPEFDVRDKLIRDFLHAPCMVERNGWFQLATYFPHPIEAPKVHITTISPVKEESLFYNFRHAILNRVVPYNTLLEMNRNEKSDPDTRRTPYDMELEANKINEFFDWVSQLPYADDTDKKV